jgi:hypothetical protein
LRLLLHERALLLEVVAAVQRLVFELIAGALVELFLARVDVGGQRQGLRGRTRGTCASRW